MTVSQWADTFRMLPSDSPEPGRYSTARVPYFKEVQDAFTQPDVRRIAVKSASQVGKALDVTTPIATPDGFKAMGDLVVGDKVFDENGEPCNVVGVSPIMYGHDCYEVTFSDGAKIIADAEHLWQVADCTKNYKTCILTTEEISRNFKVLNSKKYHQRYAVPVAKPLQLPAKDLPVEPYLLGLFIGDGNSHTGSICIGKEDIELVRYIESLGHRVALRKEKPTYFTATIDPPIIDENICMRGHDLRKVGKNRWGQCMECNRQRDRKRRDGTKPAPIINPRLTMRRRLTELGVLKNKHIPPEYLRGSYEQRLELLRGLLDSDGTIDTKKSCCRFGQKSTLITEQVMELLWTLGFKPKKALYDNSLGFTKGRGAKIWIIQFVAYDDVPVFHLQRKLSRQKSRADCRTKQPLRRRIISVEKVESRPVRCIAVDSPNHLFLAGRELVPCHNSEVLLNVVGRTAMLDPANILIIQPTLSDAEDFSKVRLSKMIADTKCLTPLFYDKLKSRDPSQTILSKFFKGGRVLLVGSNSPSGLASRPIKILLCDEVDRYVTTSEGDAIDLAAKRTSNYFDARIALFSTPTAKGASRIDIEYELGTQEEWRHRCPNCGEWHFLSYRDMISDHSILQDKAVIVRSVKWRCPDCGFEFAERDMRRTAQAYFPQNPDALSNGVRSFWINGFASPWLKWCDIMREWLEAKGNATREQVVMNTRFGESYKLRGDYDDENIFLERREDYDGEIPTGVLLLTAAVDVQANRLEYEVVGWSAGFERWGIVKDVIRGAPNEASTWQALDNVLDRVYYFGNGTPIKIARTFIDSGYSTAAVYEYCRAQMRRGRYAIKGKGGMGLPLLYRYTNPKNAGILLTILGVDDGKSEVFSRLGITAGNEGFMHFPRDDDFLGKRGYDRNYFKGLISEHRVFKKSGGVPYYAWETISRDIRNEPLDLAVYNLACVQSCVGKNPAAFWEQRRDLLTGDVKAPARSEPIRRRIHSRAVDIYQ